VEIVVVDYYYLQVVFVVDYYYLQVDLAFEELH
jgi:hypothetical protein